MAATPPPGGVTAVAPTVRELHTGQPLTFWQDQLTYRTEAAPCFLDITDHVHELVERSGLRWGQVTVFSNHTTAAIRLQENEPLLLEDMCKMLQQIAPPDADYGHNNFAARTVNVYPDEAPNGHSHCQHLLLSTSETIPLVDGNLQLGRFQSVFLVELDEPRERQVTVNILGMPGAD